MQLSRFYTSYTTTRHFSKSVFLFCILFVIVKTGQAQNHHVFGIMPTYIQHGKLSEKWEYSTYSFLTIYPFEQTQYSETYSAKSSIAYTEISGIYNITEDWSAAASYTYERLNPFRNDYRNENRLWLQTQYYKKLEKINMLIRNVASKGKKLRLKAC